MSLNAMKLGEVKPINEQPSSNKYIFGIDLGTTNSAIALKTAKTVPTLIKMNNGKTTIPSCVMWKDNKFIVGNEAYEQRYKPNVIYSVKRIMGSGNNITLYDGDKKIVLTPAEVSSKILKELCRQAENFYGKIEDVVITVPAYFNQQQIEDTIKASELANLNVHHILKEPTSASYIYSTLNSAESGELVVYDLGGGTFDVTHLTLIKKDSNSKKVLNNLEKMYGIEIENRINADDSNYYYSRVLGTYGDISLGGDDIDTELTKLLIKQNNIKVTKDDFEYLKLRCEKFKKLGIQGQEFQYKNFKFELDLNMLKQATRKIYIKTLNVMESLFKTMNSNNIKSIILVGGSTKSPFIRKWLKEDFPLANIICSLNPDETVAQGAASVGFDIIGGKPYKFQDVLPLAIGVLADENYIEICLPTNTSIPYSVKKSFTTLCDNQSILEIKLYQGLSINPKECIFLGKIKIENLPKAKAGDLLIIIDFILNIKGQLKVQATIGDIVKEIKIENIFSSNSNIQNIDEFEELYLPLAVSKNNIEALNLFKKRKALERIQRDIIEGEILNIL